MRSSESTKENSRTECKEEKFHIPEEAEFVGVVIFGSVFLILFYLNSPKDPESSPDIWMRRSVLPALFTLPVSFFVMSACLGAYESLNRMNARFKTNTSFFARLFDKPENEKNRDNDNKSENYQKAKNGK